MSVLDIHAPLHAIVPQHQSHQPGREEEMFPAPRSFMENYKPGGKLKGKKALITGGDSGIGRATAIGFAKEGADIAIIYLEEDEDARITRQKILDEGRKCALIEGDVSDSTFCSEAVKLAIASLGGLNILVNNAAEQHVEKEFSDIDLKQVEKTFRTNIFGPIAITKAVLPHLHEGDSIINTTSITAYQGHPTLIDYAATKGAMLAFTRSLAKSLAKRKIRVNAVAPGPIWTPLIPSSFGPEDVAKFGRNTPMGRPGQPDEVAPAYIFLASDDASYFTGQVLHPNGGSVVNA